MKLRFAVLCMLVVLALVGFAKEPRWYKQPGTPVTVESSGVELRAMLPQGWSFTTERGIVPPPGLASDCRIRSEFFTGRNWDRFLVSAFRATEDFRRADDARTVMTIGGHPAVSDRYVRESRTVRSLYIDLSGLQPDSGTVWTFEGEQTPEGSDCEQQFVAMMSSARIARRVTATSR